MSALTNVKTRYVCTLGEEVRFYPASTVRELRLNNGDTLHVAPLAGTRFTDIEDVAPSTSTSSSSSDLVALATTQSMSAFTAPKVTEDAVDQVIY